MIQPSTAAELFRDAFDSDPEVLARGPGRANLIGEHTDYNDGFVLPIAIDRCVVAAVRARHDSRVQLTTDFGAGVVRADLATLGAHAASGWSAYPLGVVWALGEAGARLDALPGFDLAVVSDVPLGAGLSSSAALESAVALALNSLWSLGLAPQTLVRVGQRAENVVVGAPTGILDQSASLLSQPDAALFLDCRSLETEIVAFRLAEAGLRLLVVDTRASHAHADGGYGSRRAACERGAQALGVTALRDLDVSDLPRARQLLDDTTYRRVRHVVTENQRVLETVEALRQHGPAAIGELLVASHASMRDGFEISTPELDAAVEAAVGAGALGARMTGGGFGGSAIALAPAALSDRVEESVRDAFAARSFGPPEVFEVSPVAGAALIDWKAEA